MTYLETPQYNEHLNAIEMYALSAQNNAVFILKQLDVLQQSKRIKIDLKLRDYEQILDSLETIYLKTRFTLAVLPMDEDRQLRLQGMNIPSDLKTLQVQSKLEKALIWEASASGDNDE